MSPRIGPSPVGDEPRAPNETRPGPADYPDTFGATRARLVDSPDPDHPLSGAHESTKRLSDLSDSLPSSLFEVAADPNLTHFNC